MLSEDIRRGTRLVDGNTVCDFVDRQVLVLHNMAHVLRHPDGSQYIEPFCIDAEKAKLRTITLQGVDILYDEEYDRVMDAYNEFRKAADELIRNEDKKNVKDRQDNRRSRNFRQRDQGTIA